MQNIEIFFIIPYIKTFLRKLLSLAERLTSGKSWAIKVTILVFSASLFMSFPSYEGLADNLKSGRALDVALQIENLQLFWQTRNATNAIFRITVPLIAKLMGLDVFGAYIIQFVSGILIFALSALIVERETKNRTTAFLITLLIGFIYAGIAAFVETRSYYDSVAFLFLLIAMWFRSPFIIGPSILLAAFTDERAVIAAGFVFIWWALHNPSERKGIKPFINVRSLAVLIAIFLYFAARLILMQTYGLISFNEARAEFQVFNQINNAPMGIWTGLEGGWIIILIALGTLLFKKRVLLLFLFLAVIFAQVIGALAVVDITRSMAYLLPALFVAIAILQKETNDDFQTIYLVSAIISLSWLTYYAGGKSSIWLFYPLPIQIIRWVFLM